MTNDYFASEIKKCLKMPEILRFYGFKIGRNNRIACPIHGGKDENCGVKDDYIHCFVCGASADQISFIEQYFDLTFPQAIEKLNNDFGLGFPIGRKISRQAQIEMSRKSFERRKKLEAEEKEQNEIYDKYWNIYDEFVRLDLQKTRYKPKRGDRALKPEFIEALKYLEHSRYNLECAEKEVYEYEHRHRGNT